MQQPKRHSQVITEVLHKKIRELTASNILIGVILEDSDADSLLADLELVAAEIRIHRRTTQQASEGEWTYVTDLYQDYWQCRDCGTTVAVGRDDPRLRRDHKCPKTSP